MVEPSWVYIVNPAVAVEDFGERSLALHCTDLRLIELNATARDVLARLDGQATLQQIAVGMAGDYQQPLETILEDLRTIVVRLAEMGFVQRIAPATDADSPAANG